MHVTILQSNIYQAIESLSKSQEFTYKIYINLKTELPNDEIDILIDYLYSFCKTHSVEIVVTGNLYCNIVKLMLHLHYVADSVILLDSISLHCNELLADTNNLLLHIVESQLKISKEDIENIRTKLLC